ncbi:hypothetical protein [Thermoflavimicrobium daqui]|nr:hypothetical protein [Thermoflavimicrobium daqui]
MNLKKNEQEQGYRYDDGNSTQEVCESPVYQEDIDWIRDCIFDLYQGK